MNTVTKPIPTAAKKAAATQLQEDSTRRHFPTATELAKLPESLARKLTRKRAELQSLQSQVRATGLPVTAFTPTPSCRASLGIQVKELDAELLKLQGLLRDRQAKAAATTELSDEEMRKIIRDDLWAQHAELKPDEKQFFYLAHRAAMDR